MKYSDIQGWFDFQNVYEEASDLVPNGGTFIEIGTFLGKSICFFADRMKAKGKKAKIITIDIFTGCQPNKLYGDILSGRDMYALAEKNITDCGHKDVVTIVKGDSAKLAKSIRNGTVDYVFVDGDHSYEGVRRDIEAWLPKLKRGCLMCGHDYGFPEVKRGVNSLLKIQSVWYPCWRFKKH